MTSSKPRSNPCNSSSVWLPFVALCLLAAPILLLPSLNPDSLAVYSLLRLGLPSISSQPWTSNATAWAASFGKAAFVGPQSQCIITSSGEVQVAEVPPAGESPLPYLFDTTSMPDPSADCRHCPTHSLEHCCPCSFENRRCDQLYPGQQKVAAVLRRYSAAEGYRFWAFSPCELFQRIRGRTLWFMGDSQTWHFHYAAECFLREFAPHSRRSNVTDDPGTRLRLRVVTWPVDVWPSCREFVGATRICALRVDSAHDMIEKILPTLGKLYPDALKDDVMVFNVGLHVAPFEGKYTAQLEALASYVQANQAWLPQLIWLDTAVQHFSTWDGSYRDAKPPFVCKPLDAWHEGDPTVVGGGRYNVQAAPFVPCLAKGHLRTWNASVPLWDVHKPGECTHWCSPTAYHIWLYLLNWEMQLARIGRRVAVSPRHVT